MISKLQSTSGQAIPRGWAGRAAARSGLGSARVLILLLWLAGGRAGADEPAKEPPSSKLRLLFSSSLFRNVNSQDVLAAFKLWIGSVAKNRSLPSLPMEVEVGSYDRLEQADQRIREGGADLVIFNSMEYLRTTQAGQLDAVFVAERQKKTVFDDYLVVSRRERNLTSLAALRGKKVIFFKNGAELGRLWMEVILGESGLGSAGDFFGASSDAIRSASVVLPVFFGKFDAGVVNRSSLETMQEMNPQLGSQLQVLTNSSFLPESVICIRKNFSEAREEVLRGLAELHTEPRGQQVLLIFKINKVVRFKPEQLDSLRDLKARYDRLSLPATSPAAVALSPGGPKL